MCESDQRQAVTLSQGEKFNRAVAIANRYIDAFDGEYTLGEAKFDIDCLTWSEVSCLIVREVFQLLGEDCPSKESIWKC